MKISPKQPPVSTLQTQGEVAQVPMDKGQQVLPEPALVELRGVQSHLLGQSALQVSGPTSLQGTPGQTVGNSAFGLLQQVGRVEEGSGQQLPTFASIDMGSSSAKMLILRQAPDGSMKVIVDHKIGTRLGQDVQPGDPLPAANQARAIEALETFIAEAAGFGIAPEEIGVITTAAVRNSSNGVDFVAQLQQDLGLTKAEILSGEQEAEIGYLGAIAALRQDGALAPQARLATLDLGGGSFQLAVGTPETIEDGASTQIGSNYILDEVFPQGRDVLGDADFAQTDAVLKQVAPMPLGGDLLADRTLVATGGVSKFLRAHFGKDVIQRAEIDAFRREAGALPEADRGGLMQSHKDAEMQRALGVDTPEGAVDFGKKLPASASLLLHIMEQLGLEEVRVSETDARHAIIAKHQG